MEKGNIYIMIILCMKENGLLIVSMDKEQKLGQMDPFMKDSLLKGGKKEKENSFPLTGLNMKEISKMINFMVFKYEIFVQVMGN